VQRGTLRARAGTARSAIWQLRAQAADKGRPSDAGTASNLNKKTYGQIKAWRNQPIGGEQPYVCLDGIGLKRTWAGEVRNVSLLVAISVNAEPNWSRRPCPRPWRTTRFRRSTGAASEPTIRSSASCERFADARAWSAPSRRQLGTQSGRRQAPAHRRHALVDQTISKHAAAQAAQRDDRLTGAGHRPKVRKILDTTVPSALGTSSSIQPKERLHWRTVVRKHYGFSPDLKRQ
jgi:hypothetical protein